MAFFFFFGIFILLIFCNSYGFRLTHLDPVFKKISYREYEVDFKKEKPADKSTGKRERRCLFAAHPKASNAR